MLTPFQEYPFKSVIFQVWIWSSIRLNNLLAYFIIFCQEPLWDKLRDFSWASHDSLHLVWVMGFSWDAGVLGFWVKGHTDACQTFSWSRARPIDDWFPVAVREAILSAACGVFMRFWTVSSIESVRLAVDHPWFSYFFVWTLLSQVYFDPACNGLQTTMSNSTFFLKV